MTTFDERFAAAGGGAGAWPVLAPAKLTTEAFTNVMVGNRVEGFAGTGDYVDLPISGATNIEYFIADVSQWTVSLANLNTAFSLGAGTIDTWVGFPFDNNLIYIVALDVNVAPDKFYLATVDSAGTIAPVGTGAQPGVGFTQSTGWDTTSGGTLVQRAAIGSGNLFVRQANATGMEEMEINIATGAIVSDPAVVDATGTFDNVSWKSSTGVHLGMNASYSLFGDDGPFTVIADTTITRLIGAIGITETNRKLLQWKDKVYLVTVNSAAVESDQRVFKATGMETFVNAMYAMGAMS